MTTQQGLPRQDKSECAPRIQQASPRKADNRKRACRAGSANIRTVFASTRFFFVSVDKRRAAVMS